MNLVKILENRCVNEFIQDTRKTDVIGVIKRYGTKFKFEQ